MKAKRLTSKHRRNSVSVDFPRELWVKVGVIAEHRQLSKLEVIENLAGPSILKAWQKAVDEMHRELGEAGA